MNPDTNFGLEEASMAQLDDSVGSLMKALEGKGSSARHEIFYFGGPKPRGGAGG